MPYDKNRSRLYRPKRKGAGLTRPGSSVSRPVSKSTTSSVFEPPEMGGIETVLRKGLGWLPLIESASERTARLHRDFSLMKLEEQAGRLESIAAGEKTPADIAAERASLTTAQRLAGAMGEQIGASAGRRGLAFSPAATQMAADIHEGIGKSALEQLERGRMARRTTAESQLLQARGGLVGASQRELERVRAEEAEFTELITTILLLAQGDPELAQAFSMLGAGGGDFASSGAAGAEVGGVLF